MRGRKPVSTEVRIRRGETPKRPPLVVGGREAPPMPHGLNGRAQTAWRQIIKDLSAAKLLDRSDAIVIESLCVAVGRAREARAIVNRDGLWHVNSQGRVAHPMIAIELSQWREARQLADRLPLSPWGRARLGLALGTQPAAAGAGAEADLERELGPSPRQLHLVANDA